jgi:FkbM family methyltransferase
MAEAGLRIVYDIGANNGDDISYYLLRADRVVAVEANPQLCELISSRFASEIASGRLIVENCVVTDAQGAGEVEFFVHKEMHVLSQLSPPGEADAASFERRRLPSRCLVDVIRQYGEPHYVKIDVEHFDAPLLASMFAAGIFPPYLSAECHSPEVPALLVLRREYRAFKLVDGATVGRQYRNRMILPKGSAEVVKHSFPEHSAGPFGCDIDGNWMRASDVLELLGVCGFGWRDLHASRVDPPEIDVGGHYWRLCRALAVRVLRAALARIRQVLR